MQYTVLSDSSFKGKVVSEVQGALMGALAVMPDASARMKGCVIKYIGETTPEYTRFGEYLCTESEGTYTWVPAGTAGSGSMEDYLPLTGGELTGPLDVPDINLVTDAHTQKVMPAKQIFKYVEETDNAIARIDQDLAGKQPVGEYATIAQVTEAHELAQTANNTANAAEGKADANALVIANKQNKVTYSASEPTVSDGEEGDLWVQV